MASLEAAIERKESVWRARIDRLMAQRLTDPVDFAQKQLEKVRGDISASVHAVVEHSSVHLGMELAQLQDEWIGWIANAQNADELKAALTKIEEEWHPRPKRIAEEVKVLVMGGVGGSARDLYPTVVAELATLGLPDEHARALKAAPVLAPVMLLPSLLKDTAKLEKAGWLAGLFRSFDSKRSDAREKVHEKVERMKEVAGSELLDAEPRLHRAIGTALAGLLEEAIGKQRAFLDEALDNERAAIDAERESIAPLLRVRDAVRGDANRLAEMVATLEREQPAIAVAAAAAETGSLSH
jgi:hypothetical protein